ncbi:MAG: TrkA family potassium uptake protein [Planctomycetota bacterium]
MGRYAVIGLGRFGQELVRYLKDRRHEVIAVDRNIRPVEAIKDYADRAVRLDARHIEALKEQGLERVDCAVVCIADDLEANELAVMALREMGVPMVVSRAGTETQAQILQAIGADVTVVPLAESARAVALRVTLPPQVWAIDIGFDHALVHLPVPSWVSPFRLESVESKKEGVRVLGVRRPEASGRRLQLRPEPGAEGAGGDLLILGGPQSALTEAIWERHQKWQAEEPQTVTPETRSSGDAR